MTDDNEISLASHNALINAKSHFMRVCASLMINAEGWCIFYPGRTPMISATKTEGDKKLTVEFRTSPDVTGVFYVIELTLPDAPGPQRMTLHNHNLYEGMKNIAGHFDAPHGTVEHDTDQDRYGNKISIIRLDIGATFENGRKLSMTTLPSRNHAVTRKRIKRQNEDKTSSTIDIRYFEPDNDCIASTMDIGPYKLSWGDGEYLGYTADDAPPLDETILRSSGLSDDLVLLEVLHQITKFPLLWQSQADRQARKDKTNTSTQPPRWQKHSPRPSVRR